LQCGPKTEERMRMGQMNSLTREFTSAQWQTSGNMLSGPDDVRILPAGNHFSL
jgi:hypothetical protein